MATKDKTVAERAHKIFVRLHKYQRKGANNLILMLTRYLRTNVAYMVKYIDIVSERSGVPSSGRITTTNEEVMIPIVSAMLTIEDGIEPRYKDVKSAWDAFIDEYRTHIIH